MVIPIINIYPNPCDVGLPISYGHDFQSMSFLDEITAVQNTYVGLEKCTTSDFSSEDPSLMPGFTGGFDLLKLDQVIGKILQRYDCKWTGCDLDCAKNHGTIIGIDPEEVMIMMISPNDMYSHYIQAVEDIQPYTPDNDHCYYATAAKQPVSDIDDKLDVLKNIPTPCTTDSHSETSSEDEVDVVTVPEEYQAPIVSRYDYLPRRSARNSRRVKKPQRTQQSQLSARSLKAAMKRNKMQSIRRTYRRRKAHTSIETPPSSSIPSSAHSSRCNSDNEDIDKRRTHNSSERKRREAQRTALQNLRVCIPDLQNNHKAPKVLILNSATSLVKKLKQNKRTLKEIKHREKQKKKDLQAKLNQLRMKFKNLTN